MKSVILATTLLPCALAFVACDDFASPAELSRPQILAIQSEPASVSLGGSTELSLLLADENGPVDGPEVTWSIQSDFGLTALGEIVVQDGVASYVAPETLSEAPALVSLEARLVQGGETLIGLKGILVGGPTLVNPEISAVTLDGTAVGDELLLPAGAEATIAVEMASPLSADATFAWYARPGTIDAYRSSPTTILAPEESGEGWLFVVVRDRGGITYESIRTRVQ
ncbi:MAG: hypothetical protein GY811_07690 [Myxococcales bacterium]|nr:hypothetical protein [Myxococcales bacterium]